MSVRYSNVSCRASYFTDNKELADKELLQQIGEECGLDADEVKEVLLSDKYRDEVIADETQAATYGIHAVPFFSLVFFRE